MKNLLRFLVNRSGASAVEFAILLPIFFSFLIGTMEVGWLAVQEVNLRGATQMVARDIYLGIARNKRIRRTEIEKQICDAAPAVINCRKRIVVELTVVSRFSQTTNATVKCQKRDDDTRPPTAFTYGGKSQIGFMRVCVTAEPFTPFGAKLLNVPQDAQGVFQHTTSYAFLVKS